MKVLFFFFWELLFKGLFCMKLLLNLYYLPILSTNRHSLTKSEFEFFIYFQFLTRQLSKSLLIRRDYNLIVLNCGNKFLVIIAMRKKNSSLWQLQHFGYFNNKFKVHSNWHSTESNTSKMILILPYLTLPHNPKKIKEIRVILWIYILQIQFRNN